MKNCSFLIKVDELFKLDPANNEAAQAQKSNSLLPKNTCSVFLSLFEGRSDA